MIVVSVGYGLGGLVSDPVVLQRWATLRMTDLIPTLQPDGSGGGAPDFLRFISEELMPFVNANYPADADDCGLAGDSLGGLFVLYAMLANPGKFRQGARRLDAVSTSRSHSKNSWPKAARTPPPGYSWERVRLKVTPCSRT